MTGGGELWWLHPVRFFGSKKLVVQILVFGGAFFLIAVSLYFKTKQITPQEMLCT